MKMFVWRKIPACVSSENCEISECVSDSEKYSNIRKITVLFNCLGRQPYTLQISLLSLKFYLCKYYSDEMVFYSPLHYINRVLSILNFAMYTYMCTHISTCFFCVQNKQQCP